MELFRNHSHPRETRGYLKLITSTEMMSLEPSLEGGSVNFLSLSTVPSERNISCSSGCEME